MVNTVSGGHLVRLLDRWRALPGVRGARLPEYAALATAVRGLLHDARLPLGVRLPAERELAEALRISRTTVTAAYRELRTSGHLTSRRGSGSFTTLPEGRRVATSGLLVSDGGDVIDLSCASLPAPARFDDAVAAAVAELPAYAAGLGYHPDGLPALRERIAARFTSRGLPTTPEQILVTNGAQNGLDLILRLLLGPGQQVLVESPTYPNALSALRAHRARVSAASLDPIHGWDEELLVAELRASRPTAAYLMPEFQNPSGHVMPLRLRERLPAAAHRAGTDVVVDESYVELSFTDEALPPPVAAFDTHARVLTIGSMSKPFWGGLRVGWVRAAVPVITRLTALRVAVDLAGPVFDQLVAVALLDWADEVVGVHREALRARRDALASALRTQLPQWTFRLPEGGGSLWVELDAPGATALAQAAQEHGVRLAPGPTFGLAGTLERYVRLPFTLPEADLVEAVRRLASAHADLSRARSAQWTPPTLVA